MQVIMVATGKVKQVSDGYARNYLLPNKLALIATAEGIAQAEAQQTQLAMKQSEQKTHDQAVANKIKTLTLQCQAKANEVGRLFSALHAEDVVSQLQQQDISVPAQSVSVPVIKQIGTYTGTVTLPSQAAVDFTIIVTAA